MARRSSSGFLFMFIMIFIAFSTGNTRRWHEERKPTPQVLVETDSIARAKAGEGHKTEGFFYGISLQEVAESDTVGSQLSDDPKARASLTIWPVTPALPKEVSESDRIAIGFGTFAAGKPMDFLIPEIILRKRGGMPWKTAGNVRACISDVRIYDENGEMVAVPIYELIEGIGAGQFTIQDDDSIICRLKSKKVLVPVGKRRYFAVVVRIGVTADISALSADLMATPGNVLGTVSGQTGTSGWVAGPMQAINKR